jgi:hypothetical protein
MRRIKAGSLQLVTFIVVIIALLLFMLILLIHTHKQYGLKVDQQLEALHLSEQLVRLSLIDIDQTINNEPNSQYDTQITTSFWGCFNTLKTRVEWNSQHLGRVALVGMEVNSNDSVALYLKDNNNPLALVGNTYIEGHAYLPHRGVKSGSIAGYSYSRPQFIYGPLEPIRDFPVIDETLRSYLEELAVGNSEVDQLVFNNRKDYMNSFHNSTQAIISDESIVLSENKYVGNIMVCSRQEIVVEKSANIQDVILLAPRIKVENGFKGVLQAVATEQILVGNSAQLAYPSSLVIIENSLTEPNENNFLQLGDNSLIQGTVLYLSSGYSDYFSQVKIMPEATVEGQVYCERNLELRGTVKGMVVTNNFIISENGSIYQNHLFNSVISAYDLNENFVGLNINLGRKGVAKWLY